MPRFATSRYTVMKNDNKVIRMYVENEKKIQIAVEIIGATVQAFAIGYVVAR